jgi:hypothetical protein
MGMLQPGSEIDLALELLGAGASGELGQEDLEGDRTVVAEPLFGTLMRGLLEGVR